MKTRKANTPAAAPATPHPEPLSLNWNEGKWFHLCQGPIEGWFDPQQHGNPPFNWPVQLVLEDGLGRYVVSAGERTPEIGDDGKEKWRVIPPYPQMPRGKIVFWRPLNSAPTRVSPDSART